MRFERIVSRARLLKFAEATSSEDAGIHLQGNDRLLRRPYLYCSARVRFLWIRSRLMGELFALMPRHNGPRQEECEN